MTGSNGGVAAGESARTPGEAGSMQPPGPSGLPYFGSLNRLLRNPMKFWTDVAITYGGIARVPLKGKHVYLISDPNLLYDLLVTKRNNYRKNTRYEAAVALFGQGLLLSEGDAWARQRKIAQPSFKTDYAEQQVPEMRALIARHLDRWEPWVGRRRPLDVDEEFLRLAQLIAGHYLMGPGFDAIDEEFHVAATAIKDHWPLPPRSLIALYLPKPKGRERNLNAAIATIDKLIFGYLKEQRRNDFANCGVLSTIVAASRAQGDEFDDRSLRDQLLSLFFAGHETSARSLSWLHYLLWKHPDVRARVQREVNDIVGSDLPTAAQVGKLDLVERVINETIRLHSPIHSISRVALEDDVIGGYRIPAGSTIYVSLYATNRLPSLWPEPDKFDPDRFLPERCAARPRFAFIPFAGGPRNCVGASMAIVELKLAVCQIAQRYVLELVPGHRVVEAAGTTMHPRYGMKMFVEPAPSSALH